MTEEHIFILDGEKCSNWLTSDVNKEHGIKFICFSNQMEYFDQLQTQNCDLFVVDASAPDTDGIGLLREVKRMVPQVPVLVITNSGDIPKAVKAIKAGCCGCP